MARTVRVRAGAQALQVSLRLRCFGQPQSLCESFLALWKHRQGAERSAQRRGTSRVCRRGLALSAASFYTVQVLLALATKRLQADRAPAWRLAPRWQQRKRMRVPCLPNALNILTLRSQSGQRPSRAQERTWHATGLHRHVGADQSSNSGSLPCIELLVRRTECREHSSSRCTACRRRHRLHWRPCCFTSCVLATFDSPTCQPRFHLSMVCS